LKKGKGVVLRRKKKRRGGLPLLARGKGEINWAYWRERGRGRGKPCLGEGKITTKKLAKFRGILCSRRRLATGKGNAGKERTISTLEKKAPVSATKKGGRLLPGKRKKERIFLRAIVRELYPERGTERGLCHERKKEEE